MIFVSRGLLLCHGSPLPLILVPLLLYLPSLVQFCLFLSPIWAFPLSYLLCFLPFLSVMLHSSFILLSLDYLLAPCLNS